MLITSALGLSPFLNVGGLLDIKYQPLLHYIASYICYIALTCDLGVFVT